MALVRKHVELAVSDAVEALARLVGVLHEARKAVGAVRGAGALASSLLLAETLSQQSDAGRYGFGLSIRAHHAELAGTLLIDCITELTFVLIRRRSVEVVVDGVLDASEAEAAVQDCPAILFVSLAETRILMQLREYFVEGWNRVVTLQILQLLLYGLAGQLIVL